MNAPSQPNPDPIPLIPPPTPPNYDEELDQAITHFRTRHQLPSDDAALLLVELFRIHQQHWDALRRREMPSFEPFRADMASLLDVTATLQPQIATLIETLNGLSPNQPKRHVRLPIATMATIAAFLGGYFIGRVWP